MYFGFVRQTFFTDDGCEHAKMKQFTLAVGPVSVYIVLKEPLDFNTKLQSRLVTVLNRSFCLETVSYLCSMTISL